LTKDETGNESAHDEIRGFQSFNDVIAFDGDLLARMGDHSGSFQSVSGGFQAVVEGYNNDATIELDLTGVVWIRQDVNASTLSFKVDNSDMLNPTEVADFLNDLFNFESGSDGVLNTTVFALESSNNPYHVALWVHTQSYDEDETVDAVELSLLAEIRTTGGQLDSGNFAMTNLFPVDVIYNNITG
jgi:hypothetical protein